jgi:hypothetical protein
VAYRHVRRWLSWTAPNVSLLLFLRLEVLRNLKCVFIMIVFKHLMLVLGMRQMASGSGMSALRQCIHWCGYPARSNPIENSFECHTGPGPTAGVVTRAIKAIRSV